MAKLLRYRTAKQCGDCPFARSGPGLHLRRSLGRGRWADILSALRRGRDFHCHQTTFETGDGSNLLCAGAIEWQEKHGYSGQLHRIGQRLAAMAASRRG